MTSRILITNSTLILSDRELPDHWMLIKQGKIASWGKGEAPSAETIIDGRGETYVLPGFIDIHVHGAMGFDMMDATPEALKAMSRFFAAHGVTGFLPTTVTAPHERILDALRNVAAHMGAEMPGAMVLGAHLEGPYINLNAKGAQAGEFVRLADPTEYEQWLDTEAIKLTTVAPEFGPNEAFISACAARGVTVSIGHTQATYEQALRAVRLGARHATHTFNAMTGLHHRKPGVVGAALTLSEITCELIADMIHVHPVILKLVLAAKGAEGIALITDAIQGAGMPDGAYELGGLAVTVSNGTATLSDGTLAGSVLTMDAGVRHMMNQAGASLVQVAQMSSTVPARQIGWGQHKGRIQAGYDADLVLLDPQQQVRTTLVAGRVVYQTAL
ncbi:MAG: N-acetylglucosamine-6-phosphate deacetylase [Anaerolinea sp.]|nr:N-acetylglucosamine-6-phosphate deacetylase [Anaerolinea sp.]MCC6974996.1 N-acetylglucosamine-6-phosphate deacetylase [Anaerolineae bacterium]CAG0968742.1 N-acetylglucosamine-6-phosphate deacetylase [Anaerolineae bacterium]